MTRSETFGVGAGPSLLVRLGSASVRIVEGEPGRVTVVVDGRDPDQFTVEQLGDRVVVEQPSGALRWGSHQVTVTAPAGLLVQAKLASADLESSMPLGELRADVASGALRVADVHGDVRVKSASGGVRTGDIDGALEVTTASGDVRVGAVAGKGEVTTASGDCFVGAAAAGLAVRTASGDVVVDRYEGSDVRTQTISGDVRLGFPPGRTLDIDLSTMSGDVRSTFGLDHHNAAGDGDGRVRVHARTISGDITIGPEHRS